MGKRTPVALLHTHLVESATVVCPSRPSGFPILDPASQLLTAGVAPVPKQFCVRSSRHRKHVRIVLRLRSGRHRPVAVWGPGRVARQRGQRRDCLVHARVEPGRQADGPRGPLHLHVGPGEQAAPCGRGDVRGGDPAAADGSDGQRGAEEVRRDVRRRGSGGKRRGIRRHLPAGPGAVPAGDGVRRGPLGAGSERIYDSDKRPRPSAGVRDVERPEGAAGDVNASRSPARGIGAIRPERVEQRSRDARGGRPDGDAQAGAAAFQEKVLRSPGQGWRRGSGPAAVSAEGKGGSAVGHGQRRGHRDARLDDGVREGGGGGRGDGRAAGAGVAGPGGRLERRRRRAAPLGLPQLPGEPSLHPADGKGRADPRGPGALFRRDPAAADGAQRGAGRGGEGGGGGGEGALGDAAGGRHDHRVGREGGGQGRAAAHPDALPAHRRPQRRARVQAPGRAVHDGLPGRERRGQVHEPRQSGLLVPSVQPFGDGGGVRHVPVWRGRAAGHPLPAFEYSPVPEGLQQGPRGGRRGRHEGRQEAARGRGARRHGRPHAGQRAAHARDREPGQRQPPPRGGVRGRGPGGERRGGPTHQIQPSIDRPVGRLPPARHRRHHIDQIRYD